MRVDDEVYRLIVEMIEEAKKVTEMGGGRVRFVSDNKYLNMLYEEREYNERNGIEDRQ